MLTSGILDFALESRFQGYKSLTLPNLRRSLPDARRFALLRQGWGTDGKRLDV